MLIIISANDYFTPHSQVNYLVSVPQASVYLHALVE